MCPHVLAISRVQARKVEGNVTHIHTSTWCFRNCCQLLHPHPPGGVESPQDTYSEGFLHIIIDVIQIKKPMS